MAKAKGKASPGASSGGKKAATAASERARVDAILERLAELYPDAHCALVHHDPYQLTVATILSAQSTDARVNLTTPALFTRYPDAASLAQAKQADVEKIVKSCGFFRSKAKNLIGMSKRVTEEFEGEVPQTMEELLTLPGVARKTANVVLGNAFGIAAGVVVDTHVSRLSARLGLSREKDPVKIEKDLEGLVPRERWIMLPHELIFHGRQVCSARSPRCGECALAVLCPAAPRDGEPPRGRRSAAEVLVARKRQRRPRDKK
jgi:endonuclease-3